MGKVVHIAASDITLKYIVCGLMEDQRARGWEVTAISAPGPHVARLESVGIRHLPLPWTRRVTPMSDLRVFRGLVRLLRREGFDVVHTHTPKGNLLGQLAARWAGVPVRVSTVHGFYFTAETPWWKRGVFERVEWLSALFAQRVFMVNREDVQLALERGIIPGARMVLLPGGVGVDLRRFDRRRVAPQAVEARRRELGVPLSGRVVGFVGRLVREKGLMDLIEAARRLAGELDDVSFLVVGPVDEAKPDAVRPDQVRQSGLEGRIFFPGDRDDLPELYSLMDVVVLPSYREGLPCTLMEAAAMGLPCVATDVRGCRDAVQAGVTGLLVPVRAPGALAAAIRDLLEDPVRRRKMGQAGRALAERHFDERIMMDLVDEHYGQLLRSRGRGKSLPAGRGEKRP